MLSPCMQEHYVPPNWTIISKNNISGSCTTKTSIKYISYFVPKKVTAVSYCTSLQSFEVPTQIHGKPWLFEFRLLLVSQQIRSPSFLIWAE